MYVKVITEAVRQALEFFTKGGGGKQMAEGAKKVLEVATKAATRRR